MEIQKFLWSRVFQVPLSLILTVVMAVTSFPVKAIAAPTSPPNPAYAVKAELLASGQVFVSWNSSNSTGAIGFRVERALGVSFQNSVSRFNVGTTVYSYTDKTVSPDNIYAYRVIAFNELGDSPPSNIAIISIPGLGPDPANPVKPTLGADHISVLSASQVSLESSISDMGTAGQCLAYFEWGVDTNYGNIADPKAVSTPGAFSVTLRNLRPSTTYHYRLVVIAKGAGTVFGIDHVFTTFPATMTSDSLPSIMPGTSLKVSQSTNYQASALADNKFTSLDKKIQLTVPQGALAKDADIELVQYAPVRVPGVQMISQFSLKATEVGSSANVTQFSKNLQINIYHTENDLKGLDTKSLHLYYFDEAKSTWVPVQSSYDPKTKTLSATVDHFTMFGEAANPLKSGPGLITPFQNSLQSGAATDTYLVEVPPGPGGFQPRISLQYNSGSVDEMKNKRAVGSWVGIGWSLNLGSISYDEVNNEYALELNGTSYTLIGSTDNTSYFTFPDSFMKITRSGNQWDVWDKDGNYYRFGGTSDSQQYHDSNIYYRWDLSRMQGAASNLTFISINYTQDSVNSTIRSAYPSVLSYTDTNGVDTFRISFNSTFDRNDTPNGTAQNPAPVLVENKRLNDIQVTVNLSGNWNLVRKYVFSYNTTNSYYSSDYGGIYYSGNFTLSTIMQRNSSDNLSLPATTFTYQGLQTYLYDNTGANYTGNPGNPGSFNWPHLTVINNGYGANVTYGYTQLPSTSVSNTWTRQVVSSKTVNSGIGPVENHTYSYTGYPNYLVSDGDWWNAKFKGFSQVRDTGEDGNYIIHYFNTVDSTDGDTLKLTGLETKTEWYSSNSTLLRKVENQWVWSDSTNQGYDVMRQWGRVAQLTSPKSVAVSTNGTIYVADSGNNQIQIFSANGSFIMKFGTNGTGNSQFQEPYGIAVDNNTFIYVADTGNNRIQKFTSDGTYINQWGSNGTFNSPKGIAVDNSSNVYVVDTGNNCIQKFTSNGSFLVKWGYYGTSNGTFNNPSGIAAGLDGYIYVTDSGNNRVQKFTNNGTFVVAFGDGSSLAKYESYNGSGDNTGMLLHAAQTFNASATHTLTQAKIKIFNDNATGYVRVSLRAVDGSGLPTGPNLTTSAPIAISSIGVGWGNWTTVNFDLGAGYQVQAGTIYAIQINADTHGLNLAVNTSGNYTQGRYLSANDAQTYWNTHSDAWDIWFEEWGTTGSTSQFNNPQGISTDNNSSVYVADYDNSRVQKFTGNGTFITSWGLSGNGTNYLPYPVGIAAGNDGYVYVTSGNFTKKYTRDFSVHLDQVTEIMGSKVTQTRFLYDSYGNVVTEYHDGDTSNSTDNFTVWRTFYPNTTANILSKVARQRTYNGTVTADNGGANLIAETTYYYDGNNTSFNASPTKGLVTRIEQKKDTSNSISSYYTYDSWGNRITEQNPSGNTTTMSYDSTYHTYPTGKSFPVTGLTENYTYDIGTNNMLTLTDANGQNTTYTYDSFKRLLSVDKPLGQNPDIQYEYNNFGNLTQQNIKTKTWVDNSTYLWQTQYFDGLGRIIQVQSNGETNYTIVSGTVTYNSRGLTDKQYVTQNIPTSNLSGYKSPDGSWKYVTYSYDGLNRVTQQINVDSTWVSHNFSIPWQDTVTNELSNNTSYFYDAFSRLIKVEEPGTGTPITNYIYDNLGNLVNVTDATGNATAISYDWLSRKTSMIDPDMGGWNYTYDNNGNLLTQTDNKSQTITFIYDALNRLTGKSYPVGAGTTNVVYTYDAGTFGKNQRTAMSDASGNTTFQYDQRGRLTTENRTIDSASYVTRYGYDGADRIIWIVYPTGENVTQTYNGRGLPYTVSGNVSGNLVTSTNYSSLGSITQMDFNNGLRTTYGYWGTNGTYDTTGGYYGRLWEIKTAPAGGTALLDTRHTWDAGGNLATRQDVLVSQTETFAYDALNRLTGVTGPYSQTYTYDTIGNILSKDGMSYTYGSSKPHAVTAVGSANYTYDNNGNMLTRGGQTITWDAENRPTNISLGVNNSGNWWDNNWKMRSKLTFNTTGISTNLTDFPVLVHLNGSNFNIGYAKSNGGDLRFVGSDNSTLFSYEIEKWTSSEAWVWVKIPTLVGNSTSSYMWLYYDNPNATDGQNTTGVWDSNFKLVQHLKETSINGSSGQIKDSTQYGNNGSGKSMNSSAQVQGKTDGSFAFTGAGDYVTISDNNAWTLGNFTISMWVNANSWAGNWWTRAFLGQDEGGGSTNKWIFAYDGTSTGFHINSPSGPSIYVTGNTWNATLNTWYHVGISRSGNTFTFFRDGVANGSNTSSATIPNAAANLTIGWAEGSGSFNGKLDEVRISDIARTADWMKASYLSDIGALITYGITETSNTASTTKYESYNATQDNTGMLLHAAQTFNASATHTLTQAKFKIFNDGATGYVRASLRGVDGSGLPTGPNLTTSAPIAISSIGVGWGNWTTVTFDLGAGYQVEAGTTYAIQVNADTHGLNLQVDTNGTYSRGRYLTANDAETWWNTHSDIWDIWFEEWGSSGSGVAATFVYDGDGNRVQKTENGDTTFYINKYVQKDLTSGNMTSFYYLGGTLFAMKEGSATVNYHHQDSLGGTTVMSNSTGGLIASVSYSPFGEVRNGQGTACTDKLFTGQRLDDTGLYFYGARYYDSTIGRFASADTVVQNARNPQGGNRYSYVTDNPLRFIDPTGHDTIAVGASVFAGAGGVITTGGAIVVDNHGNWGFFVENGGGTLFGAAIGLSGIYQWTNASTIFDLEGLSWQLGVSLPIRLIPFFGLSAELAYIGGKAPNGSIYSGFNIAPGYVASLFAVSGSIIFVNTSVIPRGKVSPFVYYILAAPILPIISIFNSIPPPPPLPFEPDNEI